LQLVVLHKQRACYLEGCAAFPASVAAHAREFHLLEEVPVRQLWLCPDERQASQVPVGSAGPLRHCVLL
jgi:hypothetical protein